MDQLEPSRQEAIRLLSTAVATDRMTVEQFESRLALVRQAPNRATLDAIVADVVPSGGFPLARQTIRSYASPGRGAPVEPAELLRIKTILSSSKRAGSWTVPLRLEVKVVMGELTIDLRDAVFCSDVLDIELDVLLGSLTLIVPAGAQLENQCEERWSATTHSIRSMAGAGAIGLLIRLSGRVRWSSMDIKEKPRKGEEEVSGWRRMLRGGDG